ncbi:MAG TPA: thioredoxin-disulfide reductase [Clostridiales bacterium]|nr:thioredoxin-disulfide reductase [Clostridiales bacterium]
MNDKILHIDADQFPDIVLNSPIPVIVDFYSDDCPPCEVLAPIYEKMADTYGQHIRFVKIFRQTNREFAKSIGVTGSPTVLFFHDGSEIGSRLSGYMNKPQVRKAIEEILGHVLPQQVMKEVNCDILVLGAGPAGLAAAVYAARAKMDVVVLDESVPGGQAGSTFHIANYPGTPGVVQGKELVKNMTSQAESFGARIDSLKEVFEVSLLGEHKFVQTEDTLYKAKAVILASGSRPRALPAANAEEFKGRGVHYCATCDGAMYQDRKIVVVGGGTSAMEEAVYLTRFASHVTIIHRSDKFRANATDVEHARANPKIDILTGKVVKEVRGQGHALTSVLLEDVTTGSFSELATEGAFVYIGNEPQTTAYQSEVDLDENMYIMAGEDTLTNIPGVFAAGDIRTKAIRQVVTAVSDGAVAGIMAERFVSGRH